MGRTTRIAIKKLVLDLRHLLEDNIQVVLERYGLYTNRVWLPMDKILRTDDDILRARRHMEAAMAVERARVLEALQRPEFRPELVEGSVEGKTCGRKSSSTLTF